MSNLGDAGANDAEAIQQADIPGVQDVAEEANGGAIQDVAEEANGLVAIQQVENQEVDAIANMIQYVNIAARRAFAIDG
jgi:hypothetical protein